MNPFMMLLVLGFDFSSVTFVVAVCPLNTFCVPEFAALFPSGAHLMNFITYKEKKEMLLPIRCRFDS